MNALTKCPSPARQRGLNPTFSLPDNLEIKYQIFQTFW